MMDSKIRCGSAGSPPTCSVVVTAAVLWLLDVETVWGDLCYPAKPVVIFKSLFLQGGLRLGRAAGLPFGDSLDSVHF